MSQQLQKSFKSDILKTKMSSFYQDYQNGYSFMRQILDPAEQPISYEPIQDQYDQQIYKALSSGVYEVPNDNQNFIEQSTYLPAHNYHSQQININNFMHSSKQETLYESCREKEQSQNAGDQDIKIKLQLNQGQKEQQSSNKNQLQQGKLQHLLQENRLQQQQKIEDQKQSEQNEKSKEEDEDEESKEEDEDEESNEQDEESNEQDEESKEEDEEESMQQNEELEQSNKESSEDDHQPQQKECLQHRESQQQYQEILYPDIVSEEYKAIQNVANSQSNMLKANKSPQVKYQQIQIENQEIQAQIMIQKKPNSIILQQKPRQNIEKSHPKHIPQNIALTITASPQKILYQSQEEQYHQSQQSSKNIQQSIKVDHSQASKSQIIKSQLLIQMKQEDKSAQEIIQKKQEMIQERPVIKDKKQVPLKNIQKNQDKTQNKSVIRQQKFDIYQELSKENKVPLKPADKLVVKQRQKPKQIIVFESDWRMLKWKGPRRIKRQSEPSPSNKRAAITGYNKQYFLLLQTQVYDIEIKSKDLNYTIKRTFYDFNRLEQLIKVYFRGYILYPFPQVNFEIFKKLKLSLGKQDEKIILNQKRLLQLQKYLNYLLNHQAIKSSILLEIFLNPNESFFKKQFTTLEKVTNQRQKQAQSNIIKQKFNDFKRVLQSSWSFFSQYIPTSSNNHSSNIESLYKIKLQMGKNQQHYASIKIKLQEYLRQSLIFYQRISRLKQIYQKRTVLPNMQSNIDSVLILSSKISSSKSYYQWFCEWLQDNIIPEITMKMQIFNQISQIIAYRQGLSLKLNNLTVENVEFGNRIVEKQNIFDDRFIIDWNAKREEFEDDLKELQKQIVCVWKYYSKLMLKIWKEIN